MLEANIMIRVKRAYDPPEPDDGPRFLVDRLWPRGMKKESLQIKDWLKEVAPSDGLRRWFGHDSEKWEEFCRRYETELTVNSEAWHSLLDAGSKQNITLLYSAHDNDHNNAMALKSFLDARLNEDE